jgi:lipid II:glycine glycyltransferase (peptidoglycan interpeptide bridge formation enzyme)
MGIWFNPEFEVQKYSKNLHRKQMICNYFIEHLPAHNYFLQNFHYSFTDWLSFYWKGYSQTTRYNYVLPNNGNIDELWNNLSKDIKRNIAKARKKYHIEIKKNIPTELFMEINRQTYERQQKKAFQPKILEKIIEASRKRNQGDIWGAYDDQGRLHTAVFIVYQDNCVYYIASGSNPALRKSGAHAYVRWETIRENSKTIALFDFSGTMVEGIEHFFKGFGTIQMPYYTISKGKMNLIKRAFIKFKQQIQER